MMMMIKDQRVIVYNYVKILTVDAKMQKAKVMTQVDFPHHSLLARGMRSHFGHPENLNIILAP